MLFRSWADKIEEVGTPENISDDARKGFEETVKAAHDVSEADLKSPDLDSLEADMSDEAKKQVEAFSSYVNDTCGSMFGDLETPEVPEAGGSTNASSNVALADIEEAMRDVVDPELGINVVDLGLVYGVHLDEGSNAVLDMTLTSAACPLTDVITDQTNSALEGLVNDVAINWVWMPPWGPDKITPDGREQLRALGFNV